MIHADSNISCGAVAVAAFAVCVRKILHLLAGEPAGTFRPDLAVVPGLAFDRRGRRLGFGGGYYDHYFAHASRLTLAGFCFSFQLCREVPADPWDVTMDAVCTDEELVLP